MSAPGIGGGIALGMQIVAVASITYLVVTIGSVWIYDRIYQRGFAAGVATVQCSLTTAKPA